MDGWIDKIRQYMIYRQDIKVAGWEITLCQQDEHAVTNRTLMSCKELLLYIWGVGGVWVKTLNVFFLCKSFNKTVSFAKLFKADGTFCFHLWTCPLIPVLVCCSNCRSWPLTWLAWSSRKRFCRWSWSSGDRSRYRRHRAHRHKRAQSPPAREKLRAPQRPQHHWPWRLRSNNFKLN